MPAETLPGALLTVFLSAEQLEERAVAQIRLAERLPPGEARQHALRNAASYAARGLFGPSGPFCSKLRVDIRCFANALNQTILIRLMGFRGLAWA